MSEVDRIVWQNGPWVAFVSILSICYSKAVRSFLGEVFFANAAGIFNALGVKKLFTIFFQPQ